MSLCALSRLWARSRSRFIYNTFYFQTGNSTGFLVAWRCESEKYAGAKVITASVTSVQESSAVFHFLCKIICRNFSWWRKTTITIKHTRGILSPFNTLYGTRLLPLFCTWIPFHPWSALEKGRFRIASSFCRITHFTFNSSTNATIEGVVRLPSAVCNYYCLVSFEYRKHMNFVVPKSTIIPIIFPWLMCFILFIILYFCPVVMFSAFFADITKRIDN